MIALLVDFSIAHAKCSSGHCISVLCVMHFLQTAQAIPSKFSIYCSTLYLNADLFGLPKKEVLDASRSSNQPLSVSQKRIKSLFIEQKLQCATPW